MNEANETPVADAHLPAKSSHKGFVALVVFLTGLSLLIGLNMN